MVVVSIIAIFYKSREKMGEIGVTYVSYVSDVYSLRVFSMFSSMSIFPLIISVILLISWNQKDYIKNAICVSSLVSSVRLLILSVNFGI